jgi:hypothetical protein
MGTEPEFVNFKEPKESIPAGLLRVLKIRAKFTSLFHTSTYSLSPPTHSRPSNVCQLITHSPILIVLIVRDD